MRVRGKGNPANFTPRLPMCSGIPLTVVALTECTDAANKFPGRARE